MYKARTIPGTSSFALWSTNVSQSRTDCASNRRCSGEPSAKCMENTSCDVTLGLEKFKTATFYGLCNLMLSKMMVSFSNKLIAVWWCVRAYVHACLCVCI